MSDIYKEWLYKVVNVFLYILAIFIVVYMAGDLIDIFKVLIASQEDRSLEEFSSFILAFFMLFEFTVMTIKYIEDTHNIPIDYLVLISITAILRQLLVVHNDAFQTVMLTFSILILAIVLFVFELIKSKEKKSNKDK